MRLIFISSWPISRLFGEKLDAWWFANNGFEVEFWDIAGLFYPEERLRAYFGGAEGYLYAAPGRRTIKDPEEFRAAVAALPPETTAWHLSRFHKSVEDDWVFAELQEKGVPFYLQHFDTLIEPRQAGKRVRAWMAACKQRYLNRKLSPRGIVGSGRLGRKQALSVFSAARFVSIPSVKVLWQPAERLVAEPYTLFVDESVDYAPDARLQGHAVCRDPDAYYARLNRLFDEIEGWSGNPVVIAASGKYHYPRDRFNGRRLIYGQTLPLIQYSYMVLGHASLALDQCLVSKKPVLILDDPDFTEYKRSNFPLSFMHFFAKPMMVNEVSQEIYRRTQTPPLEAMEQVVCDYLKEPGVAADYHAIMGAKLGGRNWKMEKAQ